MLIDAMYHDLAENRDLSVHVSKQRSTARRVMFDDAASIKLGEYIRDNGPEIVANRASIINPFETLYIELHIGYLNHAIGANGLFQNLHMEDMSELDRAARVGYLVGKNMIFTVHNGWVREGAFGILAPFAHAWNVIPDHRYYVNGIKLRHEATPTKGFHAEDGFNYVVHAMGSTAYKLSDDACRDVFKDVGIFPLYRDKKLTAGEAVEHCDGDVRNVLAAISMLNQKRAISYRKVDARRVGVGKKARTFTSHSVVSINLGEVEGYTPRSVVTLPVSGPRRRHEVRGHFAHYALKDECSHVWEPEGEHRWKCSKCGSVRVWKKSFERGDASIGFNTKTYKVKV